MKKNLLLLAAILFATTTTFAQFTTSNRPQIKDNITLYVLDSAAASYANTTGNGVSWDYSGYGGYNGLTKNVYVEDATQTPNDSIISSTNALIIDNFLTSYYTESVDSVKSQGLVFFNTDPDLAIVGDIRISFDTIEPTYYTFPMDLGDVIMDSLAGEAYVRVGDTTLNPGMRGVDTIKVDGIGELKIGDTTYTNVYRYTIKQYAKGEISLGTAEFKRTQYEYYNFSISNLPIFVHSSVVFSLNEAPVMFDTLVLSIEKPIGTVGISENQLENISIYPNPTQSQLHINIPKIGNTIQITIIDILGNVVYTEKTNTLANTINVSNLKHGMYFVQLSNKISSKTEKIIIK